MAASVKLKPTTRKFSDVAQSKTESETNIEQNQS